MIQIASIIKYLVRFFDQHRQLQRYSLIFIKILIFVACIIYLEEIIRGNDNFSENLIPTFLNIISIKNTFAFLLLFLMMLVNWSCEALKWKIMSQPIQKISFGHSFRCVLSGLVVSSFTAHTVGHHFGRVWQLSSLKRYRLLGASILGSYAQLFSTTFFGGAGVIYFVYHQRLIEEVYITASIILWITMSIFGIAVLWILPHFTNRLSHFHRLIKYYIGVISTYTIGEKINVIGISLFRHITYTLQYLIILSIFDVDLAIIEILSGIWLIFAVKTIAPSLGMLNDLGIREVSALYFMKEFGAVPEKIICASLSLWSLNILLPTLIGLIVIPSMRLHLFNRTPKDSTTDQSTS